MRSITTWLARYLSLFRLPPISFTDIIEVLILAFLVYRFLVWIKTTRAWTVLKGIVTILVCVLIVYLLQMDTLI